MFERYGFIYGQAKKQNGFEQSALGKMDDITPFGEAFLKADTIPAMQECFLRSLVVEQYWLPDNSAHYSPFRWILAIMLELEKRTGTSELSRIEFGLWGHTTNPSYDVNEVVDHILDLRERRKNAPAKRPFDKNEIKIDTNTAETFRHGIWYAKGDVQQRLIILPITLEQFRDFFVNLFETNQAKPEKLVELINSCADKRDEMEAPEWKTYIESTVRRLGAYVQHLTPYLGNKDNEE